MFVIAWVIAPEVEFITNEYMSLAMPFSAFNQMIGFVEEKMVYLSKANQNQ